MAYFWSFTHTKKNSYFILLTFHSSFEIAQLKPLDHTCSTFYLFYVSTIDVLCKFLARSDILIGLKCGNKLAYGCVYVYYVSQTHKITPHWVFVSISQISNFGEIQFFPNTITILYLHMECVWRSKKRLEFVVFKFRENELSRIWQPYCLIVPVVKYSCQTILFGLEVGYDKIIKQTS